jgi:ABC-type cobalamin/Fe3+-siderophores transport system ATPase subunit
VLAVEGLVRTYGEVRALDGMTFAVPPGSVTGFLGPNGAGKTTTMQAIFGLTALDRGTVTMDGRPVDRAVRQRLGGADLREVGPAEPQALVAPGLPQSQRDRRGGTEPVIPAGSADRCGVRRSMRKECPWQ